MQYSLSRRNAVISLGIGGLGAAMTAGRVAGAQEVTSLARQDVSLAQAQAAIAAAKAESEELGARMNIAIIDTGTNLTAFARMDGAWLGSIDIAIKKARTAALFHVPSGDLGPLVQPGEPLYGAELSNDGLITFPGGVPLAARDGTVIGAIGVSGSTVEDDQAVAEAGAAAIADLATPAP
jgi:uncharacterized protein GlcG (DUF336 family)